MRILPIQVIAEPWLFLDLDDGPSLIVSEIPYYYRNPVEPASVDRLKRGCSTNSSGED